MFSISRRISRYIVFFAALFTSMTAKSDANDKLLNSLEKAIDTWIAKSEFKCEYVHLEGVVSDEQTATNYPEKLDKETLKCQGIFVKSGDKALLSQNMQFDFYTPSHSTNGVWVVNGMFAANYIPETEKGRQPNMLWVSERNKEERHIPCPAAPMIVCDIPILYTAGFSISNPITSMKIMQKSDAKSKIEYKKIGPNLIEILLNFEDENGSKNELSLVVNTEYPYPVPVRKTSRIIYSRGGYHTRVCEASDFVDTGNGIMIPQKISSYNGPLFDWWGKEYEGKWKVKKWSTNKLEKPEDSDFKIKISPGSKFAGFDIKQQEKLKKVGMEVFDLNALSANDLQNSTAITPDASPSSTSRFIRVILVAAGCIMITIACFQLWLKRFSKTK